MRLRHVITAGSSLFLATSLLGLGTGLSKGVGAATGAASCSSLTQAVVLADGFSAAQVPTITPYNYAAPSSNPTNALGTTIDFGPQALVVSCVSPSDLQQLSVAAQGSKKSAMSAKAYMAYLVKQANGAMKRTRVGGVNDYLDFGNGKEDGLGSTATASSVRLDAWVVGHFIVLTQTAPATTAPSQALLAFIKTTKQQL
jgi:hypothetical protein